MVFKQLIVTAAIALAFVSSAPPSRSFEAASLDRYGAEEAPRTTREATDPNPQVYAANKPTQKIKKRSFYPYALDQTIQVPAVYQRFTVWKPPVYQLSRPYFIPIYGASGRVPIYYPPQPFLINPGTPKDNPNPFKGLEYLPPAEEKKNITNRFMFDDDDAPIWGEVPSVEAARPSGGAENAIPTRAPMPPSTQFPPLAHEVQGSGTNHLVASNSIEREQPSSQQAAGPSNCVWAIVSCCSAASTVVPQNCFEQRGCPGPFWGASPCESEYAREAIASALNYYNT